MIRRIPSLNFWPDLPSDFAKMPQEYILCDKENNIQSITHGFTLDFGILPKMFDTSFMGKDISISYLSDGFVEHADQLS